MSEAGMEHEGARALPMEPRDALTSRRRQCTGERLRTPLGPVTGLDVLQGGPCPSHPGSREQGAGWRKSRSSVPPAGCGDGPTSRRTPLDGSRQLWSVTSCAVGSAENATSRPVRACGFLTGPVTPTSRCRRVPTCSRPTTVHGFADDPEHQQQLQARNRWDVSRVTTSAAPRRLRRSHGPGADSVAPASAKLAPAATRPRSADRRTRCSTT